MKPQARNLSRLKQEEQSQEAANRENIFQKAQKNQFNHRGRIFHPLKKEDIKPYDKSQLNLSNSQTPSQSFVPMKQTNQSLKDSQDLFWNMDVNTPESQANLEQNLQDDENKHHTSKSKFLNIIQGNNPQSTIYEKRKHSNSVPKDQTVEKQLVHSIESVDNVHSNNISSANTIKSPTTFLNALDQKQQPSQSSIVKTIQTNISTNLPTPQINSIALKSKKLRPQKMGKKSIHKQNTLLLEDKQSDAEMDDENGMANKDLIKSLTSNQIHLLMSPKLVNDQIEDQNREGIEKNQFMEQNHHSLEKVPSHHQDIPNETEIIYGSLTALDQQKTLQTENDEVDIPGQNQSGLFILDNCNYDQLGMGSGLIQQNSSATNMLQISKEKSTNSKDGLQDLQEVMEDDLSTSNQGDYENQGISKQMIDSTQGNNSNQYTNENQNNNGSSRLPITAKQSPIKKGQEQNQSESFTHQQYFESVSNPDIIQCTPTHFAENTEYQKSNKALSLPQQQENAFDKVESEKSNQIAFQPENIESVQNVIYLNQDEFASVGGQQDVVTEPDKQFSPSEKILQSQTNAMSQNTQKGNISLAFNNDSNFYGSESTNEPNSVKKYNLSSSQISNNFGKYSKGNQDQKAQMSSQESNNNSQETVKLQSNTKNFMEFAQYSNKRFANDEEYEEQPEQIQYNQKQFYTLPLVSPNVFQNETNVRTSNDLFNQQQLMQGNASIGDQLSQIGNPLYKQNKLQQEQTDRNSCDKFQSYRDGEQNTVLFINNDDRDYIRKSSLSQSQSKLHRKQNSNIRFSYNHRSSPTYLEQSTYIIDETLKSTTGQNILHQKNNHYALNYDEQDETDKNQGLIPHIPHHHYQQQDNRNYKQNNSITDKENMRNYENHQEVVYQKQSPLLKNQAGKDINQIQQQTLPSPHSPHANVLFTDNTHKSVIKNNNDQFQSLQADQIKITISNQLEKNSNQLEIGDNSPSIMQNDYLSFWMMFRKKEDELKQFTCKEFCQMIWPQTLDRKKRQDKELALQLYETEYNKENSQHKNILDAVWLSYQRFINGPFQNSVDDKEFQSRRHIRKKTINQTKTYKSVEEVKKSQSIQDVLNDSKINFDLKVFSLIHILAFLSLYRDSIDQPCRKILKKINLFYLLIAISNAILQKLKLNAFDKCIKILNKDVLDFLNEIFYQIFSDTIQSILNLEKHENFQVTVKVYDKFDQILQQLTTTQEIMKYIKQAPSIIQQKTIQTITNINY